MAKNGFDHSTWEWSKWPEMTFPNRDPTGGRNIMQYDWLKMDTEPTKKRVCVGIVAGNHTPEVIKMKNTEAKKPAMKGGKKKRTVKDHR